MADKRTYQLQDATVLTGAFLELDKSGFSEAVRYSVDFIASKTWASDTFLSGDYIRCDEVAVTAGSDNVIAFSSDVPTVDYVMLIAKLVMNDGTESVGVVSDKTVSGFRYSAYDDGTLLYYTTQKI
jgi:hypothetical protein